MRPLRARRRGMIAPDPVRAGSGERGEGALAKDSASSEQIRQATAGTGERRARRERGLAPAGAIPTSGRSIRGLRTRAGSPTRRIGARCSLQADSGATGSIGGTARARCAPDERTGERAPSAASGTPRQRPSFVIPVAWRAGVTLRAPSFALLNAGCTGARSDGGRPRRSPQSRDPCCD